MSGAENQPGRAAQIAGTARRTVIIAALFYPLGLALHLNLLAADGASIPIDFVAFWAAAKLAVQGAAASAFDWPTLSAAQLLPSSAPDAYFGWHYPPTFHMLIAPLGWLSFTPAFAVFTACAVAAYCFALRPWGDTAPVARDLAIASPAVAAVVFTGNTSLLWAAAFLMAMHGLRHNRPMQAGLFIGLLTLKPQLGILIPVALLASRDWRTILWASLFAILIAALATVIFGPDYWRVFFQMLSVTSQTFAAEDVISRTMVTWYAFIRQFGGSNETAILIQIVFAVVAVGSVALLWARRGTSIDLRVASLLLSTLTATAYAFQYELVLISIAILFLARAGAASTPAGCAWLALLWILPVPGRFLPGLEVSHYAAPILGASLLVCVAMALRQSRQPA
jgi:hypothetical protein